MAANLSPDISLAALGADEPHTLAEWLVMFNLLGVVLDPYTHESGWIIPTADRVFGHYSEADIRTAFIVTADADGAREFLGPYAEEWLVLCDPDKAFVQGAGLERLPALVHLHQDGSVAGAAEGWSPDSWNDVLDGVNRSMDWHTQPMLPQPGDPGAFTGTAA